MQVATSGDASTPVHSCTTCGASGDVKRDDASFVEVPDPCEKTSSSLPTTPPVVAPTESPEHVHHPTPTAPTPERLNLGGNDDFRLVLTVPFSGEIRRIVHQVPLSIVSRVKRIFKALLIVFAMGFAAFFLRISGTLLNISIRIAAFLIGNWLTRILVFCMVAFGKPARLERRFGYRLRRVQERFGGLRVPFHR